MCKIKSELVVFQNGFSRSDMNNFIYNCPDPSSCYLQKMIMVLKLGKEDVNSKSDIRETDLNLQKIPWL